MGILLRSIKVEKQNCVILEGRVRTASLSRVINYGVLQLVQQA